MFAENNAGIKTFRNIKHIHDHKRQDLIIMDLRYSHVRSHEINKLYKLFFRFHIDRRDMLDLDMLLPAQAIGEMKERI